MNDHIRSVVKQVLKQRGITQLELAQKLGMKPPHISRMLSSGADGGGKVPENWEAILEALQLELTVQPSSKETSNAKKD